MGFIIMSSFTEQCFSPTGLTLLTLNPLLFKNTLICFYNINFPHFIASNGAVCLNMQWAGNKFSGFRFSHRTQSAISLQSQIQNTLRAPKKQGFLNCLSWCDPSAWGCQSSLFQHGNEWAFALIQSIIWCLDFFFFFFRCR